MNIQIESVKKDSYGYMVEYTNGPHFQTIMYTPLELAQLFEDQGVIDAYGEDENDIIVFSETQPETFETFIDRFTTPIWAGIIAGVEMGKIKNASI